MERLPTYSRESIRDALFELTPEYDIVSQTKTIGIQKHNSANIKALPEDRDLEVTVNNIRDLNLPKPVSLYEVNDVNVASMQDGSIIGAWGDGINLVPIHSSAYPTLFLKYDAHPIVEQGNQLFMNLPLFNSESGPVNISKSVSGTRFSVATMKGESFSIFSDSCQNKSNQKVVEIAVAFDNTFCERYGNDKDKAVARESSRKDRLA